MTEPPFVVRDILSAPAVWSEAEWDSAHSSLLVALDAAQATAKPNPATARLLTACLVSPQRMFDLISSSFGFLRGVASFGKATTALHSRKRKRDQGAGNHATAAHPVITTWRDVWFTPLDASRPHVATLAAEWNALVARDMCDDGGDTARTVDRMLRHNESLRKKDWEVATTQLSPTAFRIWSESVRESQIRCTPTGSQHPGRVPLALATVALLLCIVMKHSPPFSHNGFVIVWLNMFMKTGGIDDRTVFWLLLQTAMLTLCRVWLLDALPGSQDDPLLAVMRMHARVDTATTPDLKLPNFNTRLRLLACHLLVRQALLTAQVVANEAQQVTAWFHRLQSRMVRAAVLAPHLNQTLLEFLRGQPHADTLAVVVPRKQSVRSCAGVRAAIILQHMHLHLLLRSRLDSVRELRSDSQLRGVYFAPSEWVRATRELALPDLPGNEWMRSAAPLPPRPACVQLYLKHHQPDICAAAILDWLRNISLATGGDLTAFASWFTDLRSLLLDLELRGSECTVRLLCGSQAHNEASSTLGWRASDRRQESAVTTIRDVRWTDLQVASLVQGLPPASNQDDSAKIRLLHLPPVDNQAFLATLSSTDAAAERTNQSLRFPQLRGQAAVHRHLAQLGLGTRSPSTFPLARVATPWGVEEPYLRVADRPAVLSVLEQPTVSDMLFRNSVQRITVSFPSARAQAAALLGVAAARQHQVDQHEGDEQWLFGCSELSTDAAHLLGTAPAPTRTSGSSQASGAAARSGPLTP